jgi:signal transduction histidine kinase
MLTSLRSRLIVASVLWTAGLLMLMHMLSLMVIHIVPSVRGAHSVVAVFAGIGCMVAGFVCARRGLMPFRELRERLAEVRSGREGRVAGAYPTEIRPLVEELNGLIENREESMRRAIATAGDLAHGLKTPLALLHQEAEHLISIGNRDSAEAITQQVDRMSRQVDYHLARARAASSGAAGTARSFVADSAEGLIRTLRKLYAPRNLEIAWSGDPSQAVRIQREDLDEMLGNLLDNACKWAGSRVAVAAMRSGGALTVTVDDDGPGLEEELRAAVLERGVRADEAAPGSGLGLAIVRDLAELYSGSVALEGSPMGGLRARLTLPAA